MENTIYTAAPNTPTSNIIAFVFSSKFLRTQIYYIFYIFGGFTPNSTERGQFI